MRGPTAEAPGGVRIFACQHKTRETVWIPELMTHANAAKRISEVLTSTPIIEDALMAMLSVPTAQPNRGPE